MTHGGVTTDGCGLIGQLILTVERLSRCVRPRREKRAKLSSRARPPEKFRATARRSRQKFRGNPNAKTVRFSEIQRITVALASVLRDTLSELFPYKSEALSRNAPERGKKTNLNSICSCLC